MAVMIGIGATMGPGIFALPGELAHMTGPLGVLVYLAMGFLTLFTALNYSELSAAIPLAGGGYSFTSRTLNRPVAFFTGWFFWIGNTLACSMYALIFALTIRAYFLPEVSIALITMITTVVFTTINLRGMKEVPGEVKKIFKTAHEIPLEDHIEMQSCFQEYTDNAVSKTINMPHRSSREDVARAFMLSYEKGCKGITIFRYGTAKRGTLVKFADID